MPEEVLKFYATLAHETVRFDGEPMPCGEVVRENVERTREKK